jgi:hypothetical protein
VIGSPCLIDMMMCDERVIKAFYWIDLLEVAGKAGNNHRSPTMNF